MELIIKTQQEWDAISPDFKGIIYIEGGTYFDPIVIKTKFDYADVITRGKAVIVMRESSQVNVMWGSSQVKEMWGSSQVNVMRGEAMVSAYGLQKIICKGYNIIRTHKSNEAKLTLVLNESSHLIVIPDQEATFEDYQKRYPVEVKDGVAKMYKSVRKNSNNEYYSDHSHSFKYPKEGKVTHECDPSIEESCSYGLHVSHLSWALNFSSGWENRAILECLVPVDKIVVAKDCDGKVRTSELVVVRELDKSEYESIA